MSLTAEEETLYAKYVNAKEKAKGYHVLVETGTDFSDPVWKSFESLVDALNETGLLISRNKVDDTVFVWDRSSNGWQVNHIKFSKVQKEL